MKNKTELTQAILGPQSRHVYRRVMRHPGVLEGKHPHLARRLTKHMPRGLR